MKQYEKYKDSKVAWLGHIPEHWNMLRAKAMFDKQKREIKPNYDVVTCFRDGVVTLRKNRRTTGFTESLKEHGYQGVYKGDLVIHVMDAFAGAIGVSDSEGKSTPVYSVCTAKGDYNHYYYAHIVRQMAKSGFIQSLYRGIRERSSDFKFEVFAEQYLPILSVAEQEQIVRYLDWKVAMADKFVREKRREITLLKELRQAEINRAVTRGLDPTAPTKPSGIDWIGEIPQHWQLARLKDIFNSNELSLSSKTDHNEIISYLDISSVGFGYIKETPVNYAFKDAPSRARRIVRKGDIIISTVRTYLKSLCYITEELEKCIVSTGFSVLTPKSNFKSLYLSYALSANYFIDCVIMDSIGISYPAISDSKLMAQHIVVPADYNEQQQIVEHIKTIEANINKAIEKIENEIALTTEYKTRLISDVTTGKIDVRGIEIPDFTVEEGLTISDNEEIDE